MKYMICLIIAVAPLVVRAQRSAIEACGLKLYEVQGKIYANDNSRKLGLKSLSNGSNMALRNARNEWADCVCGKTIPSLDITTINGKRYNNSVLRGKVLVINFWFKGCAPCVSEMPSLNKLRNEFKNKDVVFIGFATDSKKDLKPLYLNSGRFLFDIVADSRDIAKQFFF